MHGPQFQVEARNGLKVIKATGHIDAHSFGDLAAMIMRLLTESTSQLVLDCRAVNYIESAQLLHLAELAQTARNLGGDFQCVGLSPAIQTVARILNAEESLCCRPTLAEVQFLPTAA
jgi:anti-anti-sigma factor